ncbi:hypothetical protein M4951_07160 [Blastopirellula sp. J2-11]|uniref:hypothetical protein n=1 Tax=Blastopirellula sp. J2-11 TaxID=2943192 RepID=UPI0021C62482|nr:hypothetical protein [Blastopirellula sp. J2-11]UUO08089.1 hypothetical protein M4951_07160 [Blastopirellula sp. J2-11]
MSPHQLVSLWRRISGTAAQLKRRRTERFHPQIDYLERREVMDGDPAASLFPAPIADPDAPFVVDGSAGEQRLGYTGDSIAILENGDYVAVWIDSSTPGEYSIYLQRYAGVQAGDPLDPARTDVGVAEGPRVLLTTSPHQIDTVQVVSNASGQLVVGWREIDGTQLPFRMQRIDADGTMVGGQVIVGYQQANEPTFAINDSGQMVAVWNQNSIMNGVAFDDFYFDETTTTGSTFTVRTDQASATGQEVAIDNNGRFIVAWSAASSAQIRYRRFDITSGGVVAVDVTEVAITNPDLYNTVRYDSPDVSVNDAGEVAIVYTRRIPSAGRNATGFRPAYDNKEEIVVQVFSGFGTATLTPASGNAAVTPTLPSFANEIMVTGTDQHGVTGRQRFARIDMDQHGNFAVGYQELLNSDVLASYYLVQYAKQIDNGSWVGFQKAATDVIGQTDLYNGSAAVELSLAMNSRGDIVTLFTSGTETVSGDEVDIFARRFGFQLPQVTDPPVDPPTVVFTPEQVVGYGGSGQDQTPDGLAVSEDGSTLTLTGNTWKQVLGSFVITEYTILEFDFDLLSEGEIHAIGFDVDDEIAPDMMFRIAGTQDWGIDATSLRVEGTNKVRIPVGQFYTSTAENPFTRIVLINDDDGDASAQSSFSNIRLFDDVPTTSINIGGSDVAADVSSYGENQDHAINQVTIDSETNSITIEGNAWKKINLPEDIVITENTILQFEFNAEILGEIHAIGFSNDPLNITPEQTFRIAGSQDWGINATNNDRLLVDHDNDPATPNVFQIPVGQFFTGSFDFLTIVNDDDVDASVKSTFSNIRLFEAISTTSLNIGGLDVAADISTYGGEQDHAVNRVTIDSETNSISVEGNAWKKIDLPEDIVITENTILQFEFDAETLGEIHAIGFTNDALNIAPNQTFRVAGSQDWGINATSIDRLLVDHDNDPATADVFQIPVGQYFTGSFDFLTIVNDDDLSDAVKATFSNIKIFDATYTPTVTINGVAGSVELMSFGGAQDTAPSIVGIDGDTIRIEGNGWKALALDGGVTITPTTVLTFTFESDSIGEIHGIGFATEATLGTADPSHSFQTAGSQNWGLNAKTDASPYISIVGNTWTIEIGKFFTGNFDYLTLICDDDADGYAVSQFSGITISNS